ncbi:hypothetical protein AOLI_G00043110 [Acnodon oligacanthus]
MSLKGALIVSLLVQTVTAVSQNMSLPPMPDYSMTFPPLPQDFKEMAKKLMTRCSKNGYSPPNVTDYFLNSSAMPEQKIGNPIFLFPPLLSSLPPLSVNRAALPPDMSKPPEQDPAMNITKKMLNSTNLPQMIEFMRNTTEKDHCFMRAFLAPLCWASALQNSSQLSPGQLGNLLWAAKPFLEAAPPAALSLPSRVQSAHLVEMMKLFSEMFSSLSEQHRDEIKRWMKERVTENEPLCQPVQNISSTFTPNPPKPSAMTKLEPITDNQGLQDPSAAKEEKETGKDGQKQQGECNADDGGKNKSNSPPPGCPRMPWLKAEALRMMGRFFSQLPEVEVKAIPTEELCKFFVTPEFPSSFGKADGMQPAISRMLFQRLKQECSNSSQNFLNHIDRLGSLICFFDDGPSLNATLSKKLLSQMADCENVGIDQIKRDLMRKVMSNGDVPPTIELLRTLGSSVSILPPSKLSDFSADTLKDGLSSLREVKWKPAQARILAQKLLEKNITGESLLSLGSMVRGVDSEILRKVKLQGLLGNEGLKNMTEKMSSLQKKALLEGLRSSLNESDLVKKVPDSLLSSLSLLSLEKAGISSVDQLQGHSWSRTQSVYLVKKMLGQGIKSEQIRKLGQAVQGVTCSMIDSVNQSDTLTTVQTLANSSNWLSRTQVRCIANKLFLSLEKQRPDYFMNITSSDLQAVPALLLIQLPIKAIQGLPATVCPRFLEKMSQANLSSLPNSAPSRWELRDRALRCLGKNASNLSTAEVLSLGPLVCELDPAWMSSLNPAALNSTLQALASCEHIPRPYRAPLFTLITRVYGAPSVWTEDVMKLLGPLLLLNDTSLETMPFKSWLKSSLSDLLDSLQPQTAAPRPEEFRSWPDLLALRRKLFQLKTNPILQRRRREISPSVVPSVSAMEDLGEGNMYWSPAQLANMSVQSFREAVHVLGEIRNFTAEQLVELRKKAVEAWGDASLLNQTQIVELGCICQGFNTTELQKLNITSLDTLELLSICNWNYTQKVAIWQGFTERTGIKMAKLGALEMTGLGNFICGLQPDQIDQLSTGEFKEAVEDIGHARCPVTVLECLKRKAISAFGDPKSWGEAEASMMGNIIAGLNGTELASLNSSVLPFIRQSAITLILPERLAAMSVNQLKSLGPDNAAMVTETQRSGLGVEQRAAVNESLGLSTPRSETSTSAPVAVPQKGGAPQQSVLGIAVLPVVLLLLGFLL